MYNATIKTKPVFTITVLREQKPEKENENLEEEDLINEDQRDDLLHIVPEEFEKELEVSFQKGYHEGELQGFKKCEKDLKPNLKLFNDVVKEMENQRAEFLQKSETFMVTLAGKIAKKIVETEIRFNPQIIKKIVGNLVKRVLDDEEIDIFVSPEDAPIITNYKAELLSMNPQLKRINIEHDDKISRGGCIVETKSGILDSRLDEMFKEIEKALINHLEQ